MADVTQQDIYNLLIAIKDARHDLITSGGSDADRLQKDITDAEAKNLDRFFSVGRDTMDLRAQVTGLGYQVRDGFAAAGKDAEIQALKTQATVLETVKQDGERTRDSIRRNNDDMLNRLLIERNADLVSERWHGRHWRGMYDQAQYAALSNQMQNFDSQLSEARQGMVNFGTMAGVGQTSTANNVR